MSVPASGKLDDLTGPPFFATKFPLAYKNNPFVAGRAQNHPLSLPKRKRIHRKFKQRCRVFWSYQSVNKNQDPHHGGKKKIPI